MQIIEETSSWGVIEVLNYIVLSLGKSSIAPVKPLVLKIAALNFESGANKKLDNEMINYNKPISMYRREKETILA